MAYYGERVIGCIIGKNEKRKAYIAMLVVDKEFRRHKIGRKLFD
jgi:ribosomal protein S18 acetylase RimI-like enzyme